jgi:hypothetical protein
MPSVGCASVPEYTLNWLGDPDSVREDQGSHSAPYSHAVCETAIGIVRGGGGQDRLRRYDVLVDGDRVGKLRRGESAVFAVRPGRHRFQLKIDRSGSPEVEVDVLSGTTVWFKCWGAGGWRVVLPWFGGDEWIGLEQLESQSGG